MGVDIAAKFVGDKDALRAKLKKYIYSEDENYDEITLSFLDKWVWIYFYNENESLLLDINFDKDFTIEERRMFTGILSGLDFQIDGRADT